MPGILELLASMPNAAMQAMQGMQGMSPASAPPAGPAAPSGPPIGGAAPSAPPAPQAFQSPPDMNAAYGRLADPSGLMNLYMQMQRRASSAESINRGLALMFAGMSHNAHNREIMARSGMGLTPDPSGQMRDLLSLYNLNWQMQQRQAMLDAAPELAKQLDISLPMAQAITTGGGLPMLEANLAGLTDPAQRALRAAQRDFVRDNPGKPLPPELKDIFSLQGARTAVGIAATEQTKAREADKYNFMPAYDSYSRAIDDLEQLKSMKEGLPGMIGPKNQFNTEKNPFNSQQTAEAIRLYNKIMGGQYVAGLQDFKGFGARITQQELAQDLPSQSTMFGRNTTVEDFTKAIDAYRDKLATKRANLFGKAGLLADPRLSDEDYARVDPIYKPGGKLYVEGQPLRPERAAPKEEQAVSSGQQQQDPMTGPAFDLRGAADPDAEYQKLSPGTVFIGPDGHKRRKP